MSAEKKPSENSLRQLSRQEKARLLAARANEISYHSTHDEETASLLRKKPPQDEEEEKGDEVRTHSSSYPFPSPSLLPQLLILTPSSSPLMSLTLAGEHIGHRISLDACL